MALVQNDRWTGWRPTQLLGRGLAGSKLGLIGFGRIGQAVAERAKAFGMEVHYHGPREIAGAGAQFHARLETMLAISDFVSLHCPSRPETRGLIDREHLALCKPGAILVNTARGDLVDDDALVEALQSGHIAAAGLDVFAGEPRLHDGYRTLPNVFALPHLGTATEEARTAMGLLVVDNLRAFAAGAPLPNAVKPAH
jgi:lactate dehydrogenase-like 2-hydroxyacid dehydrogenase